MVADLRRTLVDLLRAVDQTSVPLAVGAAESSAEWRRWSWSVGGIMAHVIEELFHHAGHAGHAGHVDITTDLLKSSTPTNVPATSPTILDILTARERQVMALAANGLTNDEIGERLFLSVLTAKTHINRAMMKLNVRDRAQLVVLAYQTGLVRPDGGVA